MIKANLLFFTYFKY